MFDSLSGFVDEDLISCYCSAEKRILEGRERFQALQSTNQVAKLMFNCSGHCGGKGIVGDQERFVGAEVSNKGDFGASRVQSTQ